MSHIFISYSKKNKDYAQALKQELLKRGFAVWIDEVIEPGDGWWPSIRLGIRDCAAFSILMTPQAESSHWVQQELLHALNWNKPILPLLLAGSSALTDSEVWSQIATLQYEDVRNGLMPPERYFKRLVNRGVPQLIEGVDVTPPQPDAPETSSEHIHVAPKYESIPWNAPTVSPKLPRPKRFSRAIVMGLSIVLVAVILVGFLLLTNQLPFLNGIGSSANNPGGTNQALSTDDASNDAETLQAAATGVIPLTSTSIPFEIGSEEIVFSSDRDGNNDLYLMNADGSDLRNLTQNSANDFSPAWSPDGSQIAFHSYRDRDDEIYVMNVDGSNPRNLTQNSSADRDPAWSPDGSQIAFHSFRDGNAEIYVMNADGSNPRNLTQNSGDDFSPAWSSDGSQIVFSSNRLGNVEIHIMNADGSNLRNLVAGFSPAWSPDDSQIVFSSNNPGNVEIYVMNVDGSNQRNLTQNSGDDFSPAWSPDGSLIAFHSNRDGNWEIYVMDSNGNEVSRITDNPASDSNPTWRPVAP